MLDPDFSPGISAEGTPLVRHRYRANTFQSPLPSRPADFQDVIDDACRYVHTGGVDAVAELHRVIDFINEHAIFALKEINRDDTAADRTGGRAREFVDLRRNRAIAGQCRHGRCS